MRVINKIENKIVFNALLKISSKISEVLNKINYELFVLFNKINSKYQFPLIYLVPNDLAQIINKIKEKGEINSAGLYFGFIKKSQFFLSLEGAEFLTELGCFSEPHYIFVNNKGEKSILYGNKILKKMITTIPNTLQKDQFLLVFNQLNQLISIARSQVNCLNYPKLKPNDLMGFNLVDKGYYLRKKQ